METTITKRQAQRMGKLKRAIHEANAQFESITQENESLANHKECFALRYRLLYAVQSIDLICSDMVLKELREVFGLPPKTPRNK